MENMRTEKGAGGFAWDIENAVQILTHSGMDPADCPNVILAAWRVAVADKRGPESPIRMEAATRLMRDLLVVYQEGPRQASKYADILVAAIKRHTITLQDLAACLPHLAPLAAMAGMPIEHLTASLSRIHGRGVSASEAKKMLRAEIVQWMDSQATRDARRRMKIAAAIGLIVLAGLAAMVLIPS